MLFRSQGPGEPALIPEPPSADRRDDPPAPQDLNEPSGDEAQLTLGALQEAVLASEAPEPHLPALADSVQVPLEPDAADQASAAWSSSPAPGAGPFDSDIQL